MFCVKNSRGDFFLLISEQQGQLETRFQKHFYFKLLFSKNNTPPAYDPPYMIPRGGGLHGPEGGGGIFFLNPLHPTSPGQTQETQAKSVMSEHLDLHLCILYTHTTSFSLSPPFILFHIICFEWTF